MKKTFSVHAAVILTALTLAAAPVFAADTTNTAAAPAATTATTTAAPAATTTTAAPAKKTTAKKAVAKKAATIKVPVISVSKYGEKTAGAFTVTWTDASSGIYMYTLDRAEADKNGKLTGKFAAAAAATNTDSAYTVTDTVDAGKYYKYRLIASEGKETVRGAVSKTESSAAEAPAATTAPAVKK
jgi:hypothetical protein